LNDYLNNFIRDALIYAADNYRQPPSPLFADAYHMETKAHLRRDYGKRAECADVVYSNLARQMNFMLLLNVMYVLEGKEEYRKVFADNYKYYIDNYQHVNGLFEWGGHRMIDLKTLLPTGEMTHELKNDYPAYRLMFEIDREKTKKYIEAFWNAHVFNWETLETSRHGDYRAVTGALWDNGFLDPEPFIEVIGLSFINTGSDLIFAACEYFKATGDERPLLWAERLNHMYNKSRHKETGLGVYQFNQPKARNFTDNFSDTSSGYGDRAKRQLGPELGENALEGNVLLDSKTKTIYGYSMLVLLHEARTLKSVPAAAGLSDIFLEHCRTGLEAFVKYAYIPETNMFRPLLADGQDLTGFETARDGYYGKKGTVFKQYEANGLHYLVLSKTAAMTGSEPLRVTAELIESKVGDAACPYMLFAYLNLYLLTGEKRYFAKAGVTAGLICGKEDAAVVSGNMITFGNNFSAGTRAAEKHSVYNRNEYISLNNIAPLAVACYEAARMGRLGDVDASIYI
jgi:pectate lyase